MPRDITERREIEEAIPTDDDAKEQRSCIAKRSRRSSSRRGYETPSVGHYYLASDLQSAGKELFPEQRPLRREIS